MSSGKFVMHTHTRMHHPMHMCVCVSENKMEVT